MKSRAWVVLVTTLTVAVAIAGCTSGDPEVNAGSSTTTTSPGGPPVQWCDGFSEQLAAATQPDDLDMSIVLDPATVASGAPITGTLTVRNAGSASVEVDATGSRSAWLVQPGTLDVVGYFDGPQTLEAGPFFVLAPGDEGQANVLGGTAACDPSEGTSVAPGDYELVATVSLLGAGDPVVLLVPPTPVAVTEGL